MPSEPPSPPRRRPTYLADVVFVQRLTPHLIRIVLGGEGLSAFTVSGEHTDHYVKLLFPPHGAAYAHPFEPADIEQRLPREHWPVTRTYTVRSWDDRRHRMTIDIVVHGDEGLAGPWAQTVRPGDCIRLLGPGGGYTPNPEAAWHLLVGDESALPAIAVTLERLEAGVTALVFLEVENHGEEQRLSTPANAAVTWVSRTGSPVSPGTELLDALRSAAFPEGVADAFVHGEAGLVKAVRHYLRFDRQVPRDALSASGYWRRGCTDEGWRAVKAQWKAEIEDEEAAVPAS